MSGVKTQSSLTRTALKTRFLEIVPVVLLSAILWFTLPCLGAVTSIGPFQGTSSENFDALGLRGARQSARILGGTAIVTNLTAGGALKFELSSSLDGDLVVPRSPPVMMGQIGISQWVFDTPLSQFGSYFENNSRFDNATVDFYDLTDNLIGSVTATDPLSPEGWTWNGWHSDVPMHRLVITGNDAGFFHGFIWFDDVQTLAVPEPSSVLLLFALLGLTIMFVARSRAGIWMPTPCHH